MHSSRSQSAMEYLTTYGWLILIIAVVLGVLFELGIFNPANFASKAQLGACQVYRPDGPGTTNFVSLAGECSGYLPKFVAYMDGYSGLPIVVNVTKYRYLPNQTDAITILAWVRISPSDTTGWQRVVSYGTEACNGQSAGLEINGGSVVGSVTYDSECGPSTWTSTLGVNDNKWHMIGIVIPEGGGSSNVGLYFDGTAEPHAGTNTGTASITRQYIVLGGGAGTPGIIGYIANVQIYDTALTPNAIDTVYHEGIGGTPINLQNLIGWWPLNGNANDYSGDNNNGQINSVTFTSSWTNGYSAP